MLPSLPVPSKGALRTLRNLALGTSCTVAFSAGMLTEDRRRRIQAAREVHNNAQKIKASRQYHCAGTTLTSTFDEQLLGYRDDGFWQPQEAPYQSEVKKREELLLWRPLTTNNRPAPIPIKRYTLYEPGASTLPWAPVKPSLELLKSPEPPDKGITKSNAHNRQHRLAIDVTKLLGAGDDPVNVDAAALRFVDAFEEGLPLFESGLCQKLLDSAVQLSRACAAQGKLETSGKILDVVLSCGPLSAELFFSFNPEAFIESSLDGPHNPIRCHKDLDIMKLKKACAIFLADFKDGPIADIPRARTWTKLGHQLCSEACFFGLFKLTEDIFWRLEKSSGDSASQAVQYLIAATHAQSDYKRVVQYFRRFYTRTSPSQDEFYRIGNLVIDAAIGIPQQDFKLAEETIYLMIDMAKREGLTTSTTYLLKFIGTVWRTRKDIFEIRALFERIKPLLPFTSHPQAVYGAVIQFCIEAGNEDSGHLYYSQMRKEYESNPNDVRIHGHFAYSKAMREDWDGVRHDFRHMKASRPNPDEYSDAFTPILLLFAKSESVRDTEEFLQEFVELFGVKMTPYISNIMIDKYLQAKEIDSVSRWFEYMHTTRTSISPEFFNTVLINCYRKWNFNFHELGELYRSVIRLGDWTSRFINQRTKSTLRHLAISNDAVEQLISLGIDLENCVDQNSVRDGMATYLARGDAFSALKQYRRAVAENIPVSASALSLAVQASLRLHPNNVDVAAALLQDAWQKGRDVNDALSSIFIHQISIIYTDITTGCEDVREIARNTINALERRGIPIPTRIVTHTMSVLSKRKQYRLAIDFWATLSARNGRLPMSLDHATLTVLLQAYLALQDSAGLRWVMQMLRVHELIPDKRFKGALKEARRQERKKRDEGRYVNISFHKEIIHALEVVLDLRAGALEEKEDVMVKTIKIMERAIEMHGARDSPTASKSDEAPTLPRSEAANNMGIVDGREERVSGIIREVIVENTISKGVPTF